MQAQVAVIGGGPVGMLIAAELAGLGADTLVLEARAEVSERPKATTLHARAVQCLARRGYLPEGTRQGATGAFHFAGIPGLVVTVPEGEPEPILKCPQADLERLFEERARAVGARILREHRVTRVSEEPDGMRIDAEGPDGPVVVHTGFLVGADGARSTVREQLGITSDSSPATVSALVGVVRLDDGDVLEPGWLRTPRGWVVSKRTTGGDTHIRTLDCSGPYEGREQAPTLEELRREVSRIVGRNVPMAQPRWISRFSDFTRLARTFRAGRTFLVGDAAHLHFPIGGQGLSTGVLDALNLGWKLALAVRGAAGADLLHSYERERRPAAQQVIDNTRAQLALMRQGPEAEALRWVFTGLLAADRETRQLSDMISAQGTVLPAYTACPSPHEGRFLSNTPLGMERGGADVITLLGDGRPLLLLSGGQAARYEEVARPWSDLLHVVHAPGAPGLPDEALLVRPDGYIGWSTGGGPLVEALSRYFGEDERGRDDSQAEDSSAACANLTASA
ncbi:FAD-dependent monooxygenase [Streptomyces sp. NPDC127069]|uniref:FAD-dependent monooxygenase n=1 Tax=Streptomyces sp. NPDC127069 TaxID=3347128 RepID=UPI003654465B